MSLYPRKLLKRVWKDSAEAVAYSHHPDIIVSQKMPTEKLRQHLMAGPGHQVAEVCNKWWIKKVSSCMENEISVGFPLMASPMVSENKEISQAFQISLTIFSLLYHKKWLINKHNQAIKIVYTPKNSFFLQWFWDQNTWSRSP